MAAGGGKMEPKTVVYCGVCGLPPEYCEFGPDFDKCKPWLKQHAPHLYPELLGVQSVSVSEAGAAAGPASASEGTTASSSSGSGSQQQAQGVQAGTARGATTTTISAGGSTSAVPKEEVKKLPGGRVKKAERKEVLVERVVRSKRKSVSTVKGLEHFGVKLGEAAKKLGKKFASGASVVKDATGKEQVDVQGDIMLDVVDFLTATWPEIPEEAIFFLEDGKKVPAA